MKTNKIFKIFVFTLCCVMCAASMPLSAANMAKKLDQGIALFNENKDQEAMDYFVDVMVNGSREEVAKANQYINAIHNRLGGIQAPVEVDINFKEGEVKKLDEATTDAVKEAQAQAQAAADEAAAKLQAAQSAAAAAQEAAFEKQQDALAAVDAQQQALTQRIDAQREAAMAQAAAQRAAVADQAAATTETLLNQPVAAPATATATAPAPATTDTIAPLVFTEPEDEAVPATEEPQQRDAMLTTVTNQPATSVFTDLTSPEAIKARNLYTEQKIASMTAAAIDRLNDAKGVHLYMRDNRPDALDIEPEILFDHNQFREDAYPVLNSVYELLALTQGSAYVILPPGSYTDDVTLAGIRQAMALNSYLINRGISQGKLHYNMGLSDQEPPARFANLNGLAIVFDYDQKLPINLEKNANNETAPLLSMAVVPLCHALDRSLGEAFAVDFSVLETVNPIDNWMLQVVQHGRDGNYYVVRQLEGFTPVYHQILWNGRKGIIGPELPCGKYTFVLTATDLKGEKQTLRRRVVVKCNEQISPCQTGVCGTIKQEKTAQTTTELDYKAARLWVKPGRTMKKQAVKTEAVATQTADNTVTTSSTKTERVRTVIEEVSDDDPYMSSDSAVASIPPSPTPADNYPVNNPYATPADSETLGEF